MRNALNMIFVLSTALVASHALAMDACESLNSKPVVVTFKQACDYWPGARIGSCDGFSALQAESLQFKAEQMQRSEGKLVLSVTLGDCNYRDIPRDGTTGPFYCDIRLCVRE